MDEEGGDSDSREEYDRERDRSSDEVGEDQQEGADNGTYFSPSRIISFVPL